MAPRFESPDPPTPERDLRHDFAAFSLANRGVFWNTRGPLGQQPLKRR